jgi:hypothetical protein
MVLICFCQAPRRSVAQTTVFGGERGLAVGRRDVPRARADGVRRPRPADRQAHACRRRVGLGESLSRRGLPGGGRHAAHRHRAPLVRVSASGFPPARLCQHGRRGRAFDILHDAEILAGPGGFPSKIRRFDENGRSRSRRSRRRRRQRHRAQGGRLSWRPEYRWTSTVSTPRRRAVWGRRSGPFERTAVDSGCAEGERAATLRSAMVANATMRARDAKNHDVHRVG